MKRSFKRKLISVMAILMVFALVGCRPSPKLEKIIYTDDATEVDIDHEKDKQDEESDNKDEDENDLIEKDLDSILEHAEGTVGQQSDDASSNGGSHSLEYDANADANGFAEGDNRTNGDGGSGEDSTEPDFEEVDNTEDQTTQETETAENNKGESSQNDPNANSRTVTDGEGNEQQIIDNAQYYIACGLGAQLVEMLGGSGYLYASNEDFLNNDLAKILCSDVREGKVNQFWSGDGSSHISDSDLEKIMSLNNYVCIIQSGQETFTEEQLAKLGEGHYVYIPEIDKPSDLYYAANIVAQALNTSTAKSKAASYQSMIEGLSVSSSANYYTCYITGYHEDISYSFTIGKYSLLSGADSEAGYSVLGKNYGVAAAYSVKAKEAVTGFLSNAGIGNTSTEYLYSNVTTSEYFITPMFHQFSPVFNYSGDYSYFEGGIPQSYDAGIVHGSSGSYTLLGTEYYPAIIAADNETKTEIESDWYWKWHGEVHTSGQYSNCGWLANDGNTILNSSISGEYEIYVNPYGMGDWAKGSVDSPLETYWAAYAIYGGVSYDNLISQISSFYSNYFGATLTSDQIAMILAGK